MNVIVQLGQGEPKTGPARKSSEQILALVADTEAGLSASDDVKKECADWIQNKLSITRGVSVGKELLLGNYEVSFVGELSIEQVGSRMGVCTLERYNMAEVSGTGVSGRLQICGGLASQWFDSTSAAPYIKN